MLTKWLIEERESLLPHYSSHTLGVGGIVIHPDQKHILLIKEKYFPKNYTQMWKFPGGMVDKGEKLGDAAVREVWEKLGLKLSS